MYELIQISEHDYYIESPVRVGIIRINDSEVVMIDSGSDKDAGKKALKHITEHGWNLRAVYNTHSHADHIGGNKLLQDRAGCKVYAYGVECAFVNNPILEPSLLYGGMPPEELARDKRYRAQESDAEQLTEEKLPPGFTMLQLPGHSPSMVGFLTPDGNAFLGDAVLSAETLEKYPVSYNMDIGTHLQTLEALKSVEAHTYVPAHAPAIRTREELLTLIQKNIDVICEVSEQIRELCKEPCCMDILLKRIFAHYHMNMVLPQYCLVATTVRSQLLWLRKNGRAEMFVEDNEIRWKAV